MNQLITFSPQTTTLIATLNQRINDPTLRAWQKQENEKIMQTDVVEWLNQHFDVDKKSRFVIESLRAALLKDLGNSFLSEAELKKENDDLRQSKKGLFVFLTIAGTTVALCEGFDAIASILGSFAAVPTGIFFLTGIGFALLSAGIFYCVDLVDIANSIGVKFGKSPQLLDVLLQQIEQINQLKKHIDDCYAEESTDAAQRQMLQKMLAMLITRYDALDETRQAYLAALNSKTLVAAKYVTAGITAAFFFGGGFLQDKHFR